MAGGTINNSGDGFTTFGDIFGGLDGVQSSAYATIGNGYGSIYGKRTASISRPAAPSTTTSAASAAERRHSCRRRGGYVTNAGVIAGGNPPTATAST